jgi:glycosyltransferase involved in cell wall biosynthesis
VRIGINGSFWDKPTTGTGQYIRELLPALARCAPDNDYICFVPESESRGTVRRVVEEVSPRVTLVPVHVPGARTSDNVGKVWFEQLTVNAVCRRERVDLVHVPYFASSLFPALRTVVTIHDLIPMLLPAYGGSFLVQLYTRLVAQAARRAAAVIADSECSKRDIVRLLHIPPERVHVVYLAAHERFRPVEDPAQIAAVRARYGLPDKLLLYLGGFDQRKNVQVLIHAFYLLPELYDQGYRLVLGGVAFGRDSAFFPDPMRIAQDVGLAPDAVMCIGRVAEEDKPALYSCADLFLFPSIYEGFGLPPLEAMACGTPVISSSASSLPEIVGQAATCLDPQVPIAWAVTIRSIVADQARRDEMRAKGLEQSAKFTWDRAAVETLAVYGET